MEDELILSGYCRSIDAHRMVTAEREGERWCADCSYGNCPYEASCEVAKRLNEA